MKILGSFDTKLDERELYDSIKKCGQGNAIMMKKHWIFLVWPMIWMFFAFLAFCILIAIAYYQFYESNPIIFRVITVSYSLVTCIRCLHSRGIIIYDIKQQNESKDGYISTIKSEDLKEGKYERFLKHTFVSFVLQVILMIVNSAASIIFNKGGMDIILNITGIVVNVGFLFLLYKVLDRIIDYEMDFNIFTVDQFIIYRQHGFLKTESMNIAASTIKIVKESKSGFRGSLFRYGKVSIHPEGSMGDSKSIELFYVPNPKPLTKKLNEFIEKSKEGLNIPMVS